MEKILDVPKSESLTLPYPSDKILAPYLLKLIYKQLKLLNHCE